MHADRNGQSGKEPNPTP